MKKKTCFLSGMAALALAIFTFAAVPAGAQTLDETVWLVNITDSVGITRLDFTSSNDAEGEFGNYGHLVFTYVVDYTTGNGTLTETKTRYSSAFVLSGNRLTFPTGIRPFGMSTLVFAEIDIVEAPVTLDDLTGTNWIGLAGKLGETLLDNIVYNTVSKRGTLDCTIGPDAPMTDLSFTYTYDSLDETGAGSVTTLGPFTTDDEGPTMVFSNFMGLGPAATFQLFEYAP